jgi:hypothetical protein
MRADRGGGDAHCLGAIEHDRPDVARFQVVGAYHFLLCLEQRFLVIGHLHLEDVRRVEQAVGMLFETEYGGAVFGPVGADPFEDAHAIVQGVRQHVRCRLAPGDQLAVVPDEAVAIRHGHRLVSLLPEIMKRKF